MDYNKVSALAAVVSVLVALLAGIPIWITVWPVPQLKASRTESAAKVVTVTPAHFRTKFLAGCLTLSFLLSCVSIYAAWHPAAGFRYPPDYASLQKVDCEEEPNKGKTFVNETVELDGKEFINCHFWSSRLLFHGNDTTNIQHNFFHDTITVATDNHAIEAFGELLAVSNAIGAGPNSRAVWGDDGKTFWVTIKITNNTPMGPQTTPN
jgi:hypothetical protein